MKDMKIALLLIVWTASLVQNGGAARILGLFGLPSPSHHMMTGTLMKELAHRGHDIVSMTPNPVAYTKDSFKGTMKVIDVQDASYSLWQRKVNRTNFHSPYSGNYKIYNAHLSTMTELADVQFEEPQMKRILDDQHEVFDLVITHNLLMLYFPAAARFNAPLVSFVCGVGIKEDYEPIGVPTHPLFYTNFLNKDILGIDFLTKLDVLLFDSWMDFVLWRWLPDINQSARKHFGSNVPPVEEMLKQVSLTLTSIHPETHGIRPNVPSLIHVGGVHLKPKKELPQELKQYLDQSSNGIIYMSFGTITKSSSLSSDKIMMFNKVFSTLPYNVIWKWDSDIFPGKSPNILLIKWLSQQDLLGHPNIKAFITHGGMSSIDESIYNQVPIIGIPFAADQHRNVKRAQHQGIGLALDYNSLTEDMLYNAIMKVTNDSSFRSNIGRLSSAVHDQAQSGLQRAVWWVEYALRHNGTGHLRAPIMDLYEYLMLDVIAAMLVTILTPIFLVYKVTKTALC